eukprot:5720043-Pyramimonas_sp.AAC.1
MKGQVPQDRGRMVPALPGSGIVGKCAATQCPGLIPRSCRVWPRARGAKQILWRRWLTESKSDMWRRGGDGIYS